MAREKGMGNLQLEKSGRWTIRVSIGGKRFCRSARTADREQAERFLQRFLAPFGLGSTKLPLANVWAEYVKSPKRNELANSTLEAKRLVWLHFAKWMERNYLAVDNLAGVTECMVSEYLASLRAMVCASTYNGRVCVLRELFRVLADKAGAFDDPWRGVRLRPEDSHSRRELTASEVRCLLDAAKSHDGGKAGIVGDEWRKLILLGVHTGLRLGDCCRLDWSEVDLVRGVIQLVPRKTKRHARGKPVTIPIHPELAQCLTANGAATGSAGAILPGIAALYAVARWRVSQELSRIFKAAKIATSVRIDGRKRLTPEATFHSLRHTFVSFAANAGVPLHVVQSIVGHESTAMTRHYYHENLDALKSATDAIPSFGER